MNRASSRPMVWVAVATVSFAATACAVQENAQPGCRSGSPTTLMAESVPSASLIPCVEALPAGWTYQTFEANDTGSTFSLEQPDRGGLLEVQLLSACEATGTPKPIRNFPTAQQYRSVEAEGARVVWTSTFPGGCSRVELTFPGPPPNVEVTTIYEAISFISRDDLHPA
jgi:hypothetical protein